MLFQTPTLETGVIASMRFYLQWFLLIITVMEIYLVGGAVRDALLKLPVKERDWVVVGATPADLLKLGYQPVGKDFPVFLHPDTHEEYALARTERKTGKGYKGFVFHATPGVTLIEDLQRRDLTINAIAQTNDGTLIDPYGGQADLELKVLRHVSPAFQEDPVRILRIARFAARFPGFTIATETEQLMKNMVHQGEVDALVPERVWQEFSRALQTKSPERFLQVLEKCGAMPILFPELTLNDITINAFHQAIELTLKPTIRFAVLLHALDQKSVVSLCKRYRTSGEYTDLAKLTAAWWQTYRDINAQTSADTILKLLKSVDARRRPKRFRHFLMACEACTHLKNSAAKNCLEACIQAITQIDMKPLQEQNLPGNEFASELEKLQLSAIKKIIPLLLSC